MTSARPLGVLGIDAAWTAQQPSGVALIEHCDGAWRCLAAAPSYAAFIACAQGQPVDWTARATRGAPQPAAILQATRSLLGGVDVQVVAVDMPLSGLPITVQLDRIAAALSHAIQGIPPSLLQWDGGASPAALKRREDALDALVCAWGSVPSSSPAAPCPTETSPLLSGSPRAPSPLHSGR